MCKLCEGKRHVYDVETAIWHRCVCVARDVRNSLCAEAAIPEEFWDLSVKDHLIAATPQLRQTKNTLIDLVKVIKEGGLRHRFCMFGPPRSVRLVGFLLLKAALYKDKGLWARLDDLTTSYLNDKERKLFRSARSVPVLVLNVGGEYPNKMDRHILETVLAERDDTRFGTIVTASVPPAELIQRYGEAPLWRSAIPLPSEEFVVKAAQQDPEQAA